MTGRESEQLQTAAAAPAVLLAPPKSSWADEVDEQGERSPRDGVRFMTILMGFCPAPSLLTLLPGERLRPRYRALEKDQYHSYSTKDENGVQTFVEYRMEDGKRFKMVRKVKNTLIKEHVNKAVASRKVGAVSHGGPAAHVGNPLTFRSLDGFRSRFPAQKWAKFGAEKNSKPGPDTRTTTVGEQVFLRPTSKLQAEPEPSQEDKVKAALAASKGIQCRRCNGDHFTARCPYKDTLPMGEPEKPAASSAAAGGEPSSAAEAASGPATAGKYIPPGLRNKGAEPSDGSRFGDKQRGSLNAAVSVSHPVGTRRGCDDSNTLRVTNLSEDVREADMQELFRGFGSLARTYVAIDRETNTCKGYAFVSFHLNEDAARALKAINGYGYDNLILRVEVRG
ncbi:MAG: eukaryotic translation initiation factor 3 subunit G-domain-containing protein, partial [Olpidium bornovanus]